MRLVATCLLVLAAIVYGLTRGHGYGVLGPDGTLGAEASTVGVCADCFAVTAILRVPLRRPLPHSARDPVQERDDRPRASTSRSARTSCARTSSARRRSTPSRRAGRPRGLLPPGHAKRLVHQAAECRRRRRCDRIPDADARAIIEQAVLPRLIQQPVCSTAGGLPDQVVCDQAGDGLSPSRSTRCWRGRRQMRTSSSRRSPSGRRLGADGRQRPRGRQDHPRRSSGSPTSARP